ncbi:hypothetical protein U1Q18_045285 [Sarracenia purpurea var. burkii]
MRIFVSGADVWDTPSECVGNGQQVEVKQTPSPFNTECGSVLQPKSKRAGEQKWKARHMMINRTKTTQSPQSSPTESTELQAAKEPVQWSKQQHRRVNQLIRDPQCKGPPSISETRPGLGESNGRKFGESSGGKPGESKVEETQGQPRQSTAISGESIQNERNQEAIGGRGAGRYTANTVEGKSENLFIQIGGQRAGREASMIEGGKFGKQYTKIWGQGAGRFNPEQEGDKIGNYSIQTTHVDEDEGFTAYPSNLGNRLMKQSKKEMISLPGEPGSQDALSGEADPSQIARSPDEESFRGRPRKERRCLPSLHRRLLAVNEGNIIPFVYTNLVRNGLQQDHIDGRGKAALGESLILGEERDDPTLRDNNQKSRKSASSKHIPNLESAREGKEDGKLGEVDGGSEEIFMEIDSGTNFSLLKGIEKEPCETKPLGTFPNTHQASLRKKKARERQFRPHSKSVLQSPLKIKRPLDEEERQEYPGEIKKAKLQKTYHSEGTSSDHYVSINTPPTAEATSQPCRSP